MSGTFEKLMKNRDYWRDEAKAGWAKIEALEAENHELQLAKDEAVAKERRALRKEIKMLQQQADERLGSYAERTYQLIEAQRELEKWVQAHKDFVTATDTNRKKAEEAMDSVARRVKQLDLDLADLPKRHEDNEDDQELNKPQEVAKFNQLFFDPSTLKVGMEGTASQEVIDLIVGKQPEQELREITMVAKVLDDKPAHEAARPPRLTKRRVRRYRQWPKKHQ